DPPGVQEGATDGGSKKFRAFLEKELLPAITSRYRTSNCKILVGHSYGGLFAVESLLEKSGFSAYLAIDPSLWYGDELMNKKAVEIFEKDKKLAASIYVSQSNNPFNEGIEASKLGRGIQGFKRVLDTSEVDGLRYQFKFFENEDHFSIPLITMYEGLQFIFDGYKYPLNKIVGKRAQEIKDHYQDMASRFGGDLLPPGKVLNQVGLFLIRNQDQMKEAIQILEFNKESYPNSYVPYHSLGEGYRVIGDKRKALENYKKSIELNPNNQEARVRIGELEKDK
ncbi:MAG: alpha/beta hydrolase-fold protein, partial [Cyclobacteriaceae bacterium]